eukprot:6009137-Prymnesium_polylepis.1
MTRHRAAAQATKAARDMRSTAPPNAHARTRPRHGRTHSEGGQSASSLPQTRKTCTPKKGSMQTRDQLKQQPR